MTKTPRRLLPAFPALLALLAVLCAAPGPGDAAPGRFQKRIVRGAARWSPPAIRTERPIAGRRSFRFAADRVLVRFRSEVSDEYAEGLLRSYGFPGLRRIAGIGVWSVRTAPGQSVAETLTMLRRNGDVALARPDYRARLADVPNDTYFASYQYSLRNLGGVLNISPELQLPMTSGADIKAVTAWDEARGDAETVIAIVDTGVDLDHPELIAKLVGYGHDFVNGDEEAGDDNWHGTHVAGIAAADTNNGAGIAGVARDCRILPVKVVAADGNGYYSWIIDGIIWAADHGADVINLSLGGDVDDPFLEDACRYAHDKGVVIVAAAGNDGQPGVLYPAAYDDYVLAVAASDYNDALAGFSNYGPEVDVAAPGVWILGPAPQWYVGEGYLPYLFASGTSAAAPHVAGLAALLRSAKPDLTVDQVMQIIRYTADDINRTSLPGRDDHAGYGRINMERALVPYILR
ncbi:MAG TPA: S8 family peptidase [Candidatus Aminicenantes bacterium]|nr:S8 family peptidase [Candidatus Aminicenantes bacterium]HRY66292.1 S8 family peptidase [Candidatus Aminicenantes bacterium]HRZ73188.1 S8 family peptidase [Candidatus Aminicenantes bacterium]